MRRLNVTIDDHIDEILRRVSKPGQWAAYARTAIIEKAARDEFGGEIAELRAGQAARDQRLERIERRLGIGP